MSTLWFESLKNQSSILGMLNLRIYIYESIWVCGSRKDKHKNTNKQKIWKGNILKNIYISNYGVKEKSNNDEKGKKMHSSLKETQGIAKILIFSPLRAMSVSLTYRTLR